jgi:hypothetical protein
MEDLAWRLLRDQLATLVGSLRQSLWNDGGLGDVLAEAFSPAAFQELAGLARPVPPFNGFSWMEPLIGLGGVLASLALAGVAGTSLLTLLAATLALGLILTRVFGFSLEIIPVGARP